MYITFMSMNDNEVQMSNVNVIIGRNGSGKTTLLKAIDNSIRGVSINTDSLITKFNIQCDKKVTIVDNFQPLYKVDKISQEIINKFIHHTYMMYDYTDNMKSTLNELIRVLKKEVLISDVLPIMGIYVFLYKRFQLPIHEPCISLIDEVERSLSIEDQQNIVELLSQLFPSDQFFITTHSPFIFAKEINNYINMDILC